MGAFNRVASRPAPCSRCGNLVQRQVQFKAGATRQHDYVVGDRLEPGGEVSLTAHVLVDGAPEECPVCGYVAADDEIFAVEIKSGVIIGVGPAEQAFVPALLANGMVALE